MNESRIPWWQTLTASEAAEIHRQDPVVILPLAAIEQHGPHLPLSTDLDIGLGLLESAFEDLAPDVPAYVLPPVPLGASLEHEWAPGTLSMRSTEVVDVIRSCGAGLVRAGVRRLVLANSHGGNRGSMDAAGLALRSEHGMLVVKASYYRLGRPAEIDLPDAEWRHGLHGGAVETAMMLHLHPDRVRRDALARFPSLGEELESSMRRLGPEGQASFAWLANDLNPEGVTGDATLATAEMGARLVEHYGRALADVIRDARVFPLERLSARRDAP